jgi:hypothetical protein
VFDVVRPYKPAPYELGVPYRQVITDNGPPLYMTRRAGARARVTHALSLAALNDGDALCFTRVHSYTEALRNLLGGLAL